MSSYAQVCLNMQMGVTLVILESMTILKLVVNERLINSQRAKVFFPQCIIQTKFQVVDKEMQGPVIVLPVLL